MLYLLAYLPIAAAIRSSIADASVTVTPDEFVSITGDTRWSKCSDNPVSDDCLAVQKSLATNISTAYETMSANLTTMNSTLNARITSGAAFTTKLEDLNTELYGTSAEGIVGIMTDVSNLHTMLNMTQDSTATQAAAINSLANELTATIETEKESILNLLASNLTNMTTNVSNAMSVMTAKQASDILTAYNTMLGEAATSLATAVGDTYVIGNGTSTVNQAITLEASTAATQLSQLNTAVSAVSAKISNLTTDAATDLALLQTQLTANVTQNLTQTELYGTGNISTTAQYYIDAINKQIATLSTNLQNQAAALTKVITAVNSEISGNVTIVGNQIKAATTQQYNRITDYQIDVNGYLAKLKGATSAGSDTISSLGGDAQNMGLTLDALVADATAKAQDSIKALQAKVTSVKNSLNAASLAAVNQVDGVIGPQMDNIETQVKEVVESVQASEDEATGTADRLINAAQTYMSQYASEQAGAVGDIRKVISSSSDLLQALIASRTSGMSGSFSRLVSTLQAGLDSGSTTAHEIAGEAQSRTAALQNSLNEKISNQYAALEGNIQAAKIQQDAMVSGITYKNRSAEILALADSLSVVKKKIDATKASADDINVDIVNLQTTEANNKAQLSSLLTTAQKYADDAVSGAKGTIENAISDGVKTLQENMNSHATDFLKDFGGKIAQSADRNRNILETIDGGITRQTEIANTAIAEYSALSNLLSLTIEPTENSFKSLNESIAKLAETDAATGAAKVSEAATELDSSLLQLVNSMTDQVNQQMGGMSLKAQQLLDKAKTKTESIQATLAFQKGQIDEYAKSASSLSETVENWSNEQTGKISAEKNAFQAAEDLKIGEVRALNEKIVQWYLKADENAAAAETAMQTVIDNIPSTLQPLLDSAIASLDTQTVPSSFAEDDETWGEVEDFLKDANVVF